MYIDLWLRCFETVPTKFFPHSASVQGVSYNFYIVKIYSCIIHTSVIVAPEEAMLKIF